MTPIPFCKFPSIGAFKHVQSYRDRYRPEMMKGTLRAKIKLHGTNAAVRISNGVVTAQSRGRDITVEKDNYDFALWVHDHMDYWNAMAEKYAKRNMSVVLYGEWAGPGVQKNVATSQLAKRSFFIFAAKVFGHEFGSEEWVLEPSILNWEFDATPLPPDAYVLPWYNGPLELDFTDVQSLQAAIDTINVSVEAIDESDPYIKSTFGIDGVGEGLVCYVCEPNCTHNKDLWFKVKGGKHTVNNEAKIAKVRKVAGQEYYDLVEAFCTPGRYAQGLSELGIEDFPRNMTGKFIGWVCADVIKESSMEREQFNIDKRLFSGMVAKAAREYYLSNAQ